MTYSFHPLAEQEFYETIEYYNACQEGLGIEFAREVYATIQNIVQYPQAWSSLSRNTRRCLINRFPYGIIYQETTQHFMIVAIMHLSQKPAYWHDRIH